MFYLPARYAFANRDIQMEALQQNDFWLALVGEGSSFDDEQPAVMDDFTDLLPIGTDQNLSAFTVFQDTDLDRAYVPSTGQTPTFALTPADGQVVGAVLYLKITDYTDSIPIASFPLGTPHIILRNENYIFPLPEDGIIELPNFGEKAYLNSRKNLLAGYKQYTTGFRLKLVMSNSTYLTDINPATLAALTTLDEFDGSGYSEQNVTFTLTQDTTRDRVTIDCPNIDFGTLGSGSRDIVGGLFYIPAAVNGVANTLVYGIRLNQPVDPASSNFTWQVSDDGVAYL